MDPHLRRQEWFEGIDATIDALIAAAAGEATQGGISHPMAVMITRDRIVAAILALVGLDYAAYLLIARQRKRSKARG